VLLNQSEFNLGFNNHIQGDRIIRLLSVCKDYLLGGRKIRAIDNVSLEISQGDFVVIRGASGSGKTTLLNLIGALDKPSSGKVIFFNQDLTDRDEDFLATFRAAYIGFVFQSYNLISTLTAIENISFALEISGWAGDKIRKQAYNLLELVGLSHRADHLPNQLSGGEQQRVAFARALANDQPVLIADEPTGNLDEKTGLEILKIFQKLKTEGKTVITATHDERIIQLANKTLHLQEGRAVRIDGCS
jgi:putative ABC transport system ATP-binding protein